MQGFSRLRMQTQFILTNNKPEVVIFKCSATHAETHCRTQDSMYMVSISIHIVFSTKYNLEIERKGQIVQGIHLCILLYY